MSAGRLRYLRHGDKQPKTPAFRLSFEDGSSLVLTEAGAKKRAKVGLYTPEAIEEELAHLGPEAYGLGTEQLGEILASDSRRLHAFLRDQRLIAGIGRAWANEILNHAQLSPYALTTELSEEEVAAAERRRSRSSRAGSSSGARRLRQEDLPRAQPPRRAVPTLRHRRSRASISTSTRSTTARPARPRGGSSRTADCPGFCASHLAGRLDHAGRTACPSPARPRPAPAQERRAVRPSVVIALYASQQQTMRVTSGILGGARPDSPGRPNALAGGRAFRPRRADRHALRHPLAFDRGV